MFAGLLALFALTLAAAAASAMVIVNTVVMVQSQMGLTQTSTAIALACFGAGSMVMALALPRLLDKVRERPPCSLAHRWLQQGWCSVGSLPPGSRCFCPCGS